jgi:hypothetical protein
VSERTVSEATTAIANGAGVATLTIAGPGRGYLAVDSLAVTVTPSSPRPQCDLYEGPPAPGGAMATLRAGDKGTFRSTNDKLDAGRIWTVQWTGAAPGAVCTAILRGTAYAP